MASTGNLRPTWKFSKLGLCLTGTHSGEFFVTEIWSSSQSNMSLAFYKTNNIRNKSLGSFNIHFSQHGANALPINRWMKRGRGERKRKETHKEKTDKRYAAFILHMLCILCCYYDTLYLIA